MPPHRHSHLRSRGGTGRRVQNTLPHAGLLCSQQPGGAARRGGNHLVSNNEPVPAWPARQCTAAGYSTLGAPRNMTVSSPLLRAFKFRLQILLARLYLPLPTNHGDLARGNLGASRWSRHGGCGKACLYFLPGLGAFLEHRLPGRITQGRTANLSKQQDRTHLPHVPLLITL